MAEKKATSHRLSEIDHEIKAIREKQSQKSHKAKPENKPKISKPEVFRRMWSSLMEGNLEAASEASREFQGKQVSNIVQVNDGCVLSFTSTPKDLNSC